MLAHEQPTSHGEDHKHDGLNRRNHEEIFVSRQLTVARRLILARQFWIFLIINFLLNTLSCNLLLSLKEKRFHIIL
jgi:hypothetical protein